MAHAKREAADAGFGDGDVARHEKIFPSGEEALAWLRKKEPFTSEEAGTTFPDRRIKKQTGGVRDSVDHTVEARSSNGCCRRRPPRPCEIQQAGSYDAKR
jgi:hypothetical protein